MTLWAQQSENVATPETPLALELAGFSFIDPDQGNAMQPEHQLLTLKTGQARKTGLRSQGHIAYRLLCRPSRHDLLLTIESNEGGGYFSKELVPFNDVLACIQSIQNDKPVPSKAFKDAFVSQSANNAGFLAAILRAEGLLSAASDAGHHHLLQGDWEEWKRQILALPGEIYVPATSNAEPEKKEPLSSPGKRKGAKSNSSKASNAAAQLDAEPETNPGPTEDNHESHP